MNLSRVVIVNIVKYLDPVSSKYFTQILRCRSIGVLDLTRNIKNAKYAVYSRNKYAVEKIKLFRWSFIAACKIGSVLIAKYCFPKIKKNICVKAYYKAVKYNNVNIINFLENNDIKYGHEVDIMLNLEKKLHYKHRIMPKYLANFIFKKGKSEYIEFYLQKMKNYCIADLLKISCDNKNLSLIEWGVNEIGLELIFSFCFNESSDINLLEFFIKKYSWETLFPFLANITNEQIFSYFFQNYKISIKTVKNLIKEDIPCSVLLNIIKFYPAINYGYYLEVLSCYYTPDIFKLDFLLERIPNLNIQILARFVKVEEELNYICSRVDKENFFYYACREDNKEAIKYFSEFVEEFDIKYLGPVSNKKSIMFLIYKYKLYRNHPEQTAEKLKKHSLCLNTDKITANDILVMQEYFCIVDYHKNFYCKNCNENF